MVDLPETVPEGSFAKNSFSLCINENLEYGGETLIPEETVYHVGAESAANAASVTVSANTRVSLSLIVATRLNAVSARTLAREELPVVL